MGFYFLQYLIFLNISSTQHKSSQVHAHTKQTASEKSPMLAYGISHGTSKKIKCSGNQHHSLCNWSVKSIIFFLLCHRQNTKQACQANECQFHNGYGKVGKWETGRGNDRPLKVQLFKIHCAIFQHRMLPVVQRTRRFYSKIKSPHYLDSGTFTPHHPALHIPWFPGHVMYGIYAAAGSKCCMKASPFWTKTNRQLSQKPKVK